MSKTPEQIRDQLSQALDVSIEWRGPTKEVEEDPKKKWVGDSWLIIPVEKWRQACQLIRDDSELAFDYLRSLSGVDRPDDQKIDIVIHLLSYKHRHTLVMKTILDRENPQIDSLAEIWPAANWYEREVFDLFGVEVNNHPDLRRLLMPSDWVGHPLRKDYQAPESYNGIPTSRPTPAINSGESQ
jgi:NADH-quinone oxidoreductase subunit C